MLRRVVAAVAGDGVHQWRMVSRRLSSSVSSAVNSMLLRSLKDHYLEVSNMAPPPKVGTPSEFTILKGALDSTGPVLRKNFKNEEISISVMRLASFVSLDNDEEDDDDDGINQLFVHVEVSKPAKEVSLHFLCGLYPDALGIHSVALRPKSQDGFIIIRDQYTGPLFENLDEETRDAFHNYIEERGINESLFPFLQSWLYVKDHRNLMRWFRTVGQFIKGADEPKAVSGANKEPKEAAKA